MKINLKSWKLWGGILVIPLLLIIAFIMISPYIAPETSTMVDSCPIYEDTKNCLLFPTFSGENLLGYAVVFPDAFTAEYTLAVVMFGREHLPKIDDWIEIVIEFEDIYPDLAFYGVPIFPDVAPFARVAAKGGMVVGLDSSLHDNVIMIFLENRDEILPVLDLPDFENMQVYIINIDGEILWRIEGDFTEEKAEELRQQVALLLGD